MCDRNGSGSEVLLLVSIPRVTLAARSRGAESQGPTVIVQPATGRWGLLVAKRPTARFDGLGDVDLEMHRPDPLTGKASETFDVYVCIPKGLHQERARLEEQRHADALATIEDMVERNKVQGSRLNRASTEIHDLRVEVRKLTAVLETKVREISELAALYEQEPDA